MPYPCHLAVMALTALLAPSPAVAQRGSEGIVYIPGKPLTMTIPDPDAVKWEGRQDRPGYRYRGMLPLHQRFYDYIQAKRGRGEALSYAERWLIARLQAYRRWPEAPVPDQFWRDYMKYLRNLDRSELNLGEQVMLGELVARGYLPADPPEDDPLVARFAFYLQTADFGPKNWFERRFGRVNTWLDHAIAQTGSDMRTGGPGAGVYPGEPFNGMQIRYSVTGATLGPPEDKQDFTTTRSHKGVLAAGTLTVSGSGSQESGFGADLTVRVWAGEKEDKFEAHITTPGKQAFSVSVPVPKGTESGGFSIFMSGSYSMGGGYRGLEVAGTLERSADERAADAAAAEADWKRKVEETLQALGYEDTPEGKALGELREALHGDDATWKAYVDRQQKLLGYDDTPEAKEYYALRDAVTAGGEAWDKYEQEHGGIPGGEQPAGDGQGPAADSGKDGSTAPSGGGGGSAGPDVGGLTVGTGSADGQVQGATDHFGKTAKVETAIGYSEMPADTPCEAVWVRDGEEVGRSQRTLVGSGWVSFDLHTKDGTALPPGRYTVTITAGGKVLGRKSFTVGE